MKLVSDAYYGFWSLVYVFGMTIAIPSGMVSGWENTFALMWLPLVVVACWTIKFLYILVNTIEFILFGDPNDEDYKELTKELFGCIDTYVATIEKTKNYG